MSKFRVRLYNYFYALELYDEKGREIFTLEEAIAAAESQFGKNWREVYNGHEGIDRESWKDSQLNTQLNTQEPSHVQ